MNKADIVFPRNNEEKFIEMSSRLGYGVIFFIYPLKDFCKAEERITELREQTNIKLNIGIIAGHQGIQKAANKCSFVIAESALDTEKDRLLFESKKLSMIYGLELSPRKDSLHYRNSGLNQVLCKLAADHNITIGFSFRELLLSKGRRRAQLLGRMQQNIRLCRKYEVKTMMASFAEESYGMRGWFELRSFLS